MKNTKFAVTVFNLLGFICTPATLVLAILWFLQPDKNYEPITVALGSLSVIFFGVAQIIQRKLEPQEKQAKKFNELSTDEILQIINGSISSDWDLSFNKDAEIAVFKKNPSLRIETRHTEEFIHNDDFREKWANEFPDPHATSYYYQLYFGATKLREFVLVSVDGGRALLPLPKSAKDLSVEPVRYKVATIFDQIGSCDEYMKIAGLYLAKQEKSSVTSREDELKRNLDLKRRIQKDFGAWLNYLPENRKRNSKMLLRAFDGKQYPDSNEPDKYGEYSWFAAEIKGIYHSGLEFIYGVEEIVVYNGNKWGFRKNAEGEYLATINAYRVGQINFSDIVDYDLEGDEYYPFPHFFCKLNTKDYHLKKPTFKVWMKDLPITLSSKTRSLESQTPAVSQNFPIWMRAINCY